MNERLLSPGMFDSLVKDFYEYMDIATQPKPAAMEKWYRKLSNVLESDIELAFEKMKDTETQKPRNLPKAVRSSLFLVWGDQGKNLKEWVDYGPCNDCNGSGFFVIRYYHEAQKSWPECIIFCKSCKTYLNYAHESAPRASANFLQNIGARFKPGPKVGDKTIHVSKMKGIAENIGKDITIPTNKALSGGTGKHLSDAEKKKFVEMFKPKTKNKEA